MTEKMMKFLEAAEKDTALAKAVQDAATLEDVVALANAKGYELTTKDLRPELPVGEIDDDALDDVAGGAFLRSSKAGSAKAASAFLSAKANSAHAASNYAGSSVAASAFAGSAHAASSFAGSAVANSAVLRSIYDKCGGNDDWLITK